MWLIEQGNTHKTKENNKTQKNKKKPNTGITINIIKDGVFVLLVVQTLDRVPGSSFRCGHAGSQKSKVRAKFTLE